MANRLRQLPEILSRECHRFVNPCGLVPWVPVGVGMGWDCVTLAQPIPVTWVWQVWWDLPVSVIKSHAVDTNTMSHQNTSTTSWKNHGAWGIEGGGAVDTMRGQAYKVCPHLFIFILHTNYMNLCHIIPCHVDLCQLMPPHRPALHWPTHEVHYGQYHTHPIHPTHHMSTNHTHECDQMVQIHQVYDWPPTHQVGCNQLGQSTPPPPTLARVPQMIWWAVH